MKRTTFILGLVMLTGIIISCKKNAIKSSGFLGTNICASSGFHYLQDFKVNGVDNPAAADFTSTPYYVSLTAGLSEEVSWTITITGQTSGAVKTYTEVSNTVDVKWYGNANGDIFFQDREQCTISFQPSCKEAVVKNITIAHKSTFSQFGVLIFDADNLLAANQKAVRVISVPQVKIKDTLYAFPSPQGGKCNILYAPDGLSEWYFGAVFQAGAGGVAAKMANFATGLSSDDIYVNFYLKGSSNTIGTIVLYEATAVAGEVITWKRNINITWNGWKMVSYKLSDLNVGDPSKIQQVEFTVSPKVYNTETEAYVDFCIITKGKPFAGAN